MSRFWNVRGVATLWSGWTAAVVVSLMLVLPAAGQDVPYVGIVTEANVEVRAGAAKNFYVVNRLDKGTIVRVEDVFSGWVMIEPPEGTYSIITKAHVDAKGDGRTGVVNTERAVVRAAGLDVPVRDWFRTHAYLKMGDTVQIVGEVDSFYKIVSPKNAWVYLAPGTVRRATAAEIRQAGGVEPEPAPEPVRPQPEPVQPRPVPVTPVEPVRPTPMPEPTPTPEAEPATPDTPTPAPVEEEAAPQPTEPAEPTTPATPTTPVEPTTPTTPAAQDSPKANDLPRATSPAVRAAEQRFAEASTRELVKQPIDELIAEYRKLRGEELPALDRHIVNTRLAQLERNKAVADILKKGNQLKEEMASRPKVDVKALERQAMRAGGYAAMGKLAASTVYDGEGLPRLYRLVDGGSGRTLAYVRPGPNVDARMMGKLVGIYGEMRYDPALKLNLIDVQEMEVLEAQGQPTP